MFEVPPSEGKSRFHDFNLPDPILHAVADLEFRYCTPIQAAIIPHLLAGRDSAGRAQTGTGKTAAFLVAIFTHFLRHPLTERRKNGTPRALILSPTRELALQIGRDAADLGKYCPFRTVTVYGGAEYEKQQRALRDRTVDIVAATPGRLLDFKRSGVLNLKEVEILVIDEADRMLDMGFIPDVSIIIRSTPPKERRQTMLFSATLTDAVMRLASQWLKDPVKVDIEPEQVAVNSVNQIVYLVTSEEKFAVTINLLKRECPSRALIFGNRRDETERLMRELRRFGIHCALLSGAVPQNVRTRTLEQFREGKLPVLVATDVAGRGLHIEGVSHVINFNIPEDPEDYVHRIGRTGRAGELGTSITFACEDESFKIPAIETYIGHALRCTQPEDDWLILPEPLHSDVTPALRRPGNMEHRSTSYPRRSGARRGPPRRKRR
jgi:ATP-dependent RNA helicase RhlB